MLRECGGQCPGSSSGNAEEDSGSVCEEASRATGVMRLSPEVEDELERSPTDAVAEWSDMP